MSKKLKIIVVFTAYDTLEIRSDDFLSLKDSKFDYRLIDNKDYENRSIRKNISSLKKIMKEISYRKLLVSGWDTLEDWYLIFKNNKSINCLALESTVNESISTGIRGFMKKIFINRISTIFASGSLHQNLLDQLNYKGDIKITKGVGIINKPNKCLKYRKYNKKFLFIGRLSSEKNIQSLICTFNELMDHKLTIIGSGPLEKELKSQANKNISFLGKKTNLELKKYFENHDILLLPSISEPWGLVVEEALYFGVPVIVSKTCGVCELIDHGKNGYIVDMKNRENIKDIIINLDNEKFQELAAGIESSFIDQKDYHQVMTYVKC
tara:strand:+ start:27307 stop:28275 length:969 start_codon:yes stop_codon:yes gene_type:complete